MDFIQHLLQASMHKIFIIFSLIRLKKEKKSSYSID